jgi:hypothetical protein
MECGHYSGKGAEWQLAREIVTEKLSAVTDHHGLGCMSEATAILMCDEESAGLRKMLAFMCTLASTFNAGLV